MRRRGWSSREPLLWRRHFLTAFGAAGAAAAAAATAIGSSCVMSGFIGSMIIQASDLGDSISSACADFGNWLFPPSAAGTISTGLKKMFTPTANLRRGLRVVCYQRLKSPLFLRPPRSILFSIMRAPY
ncbi:Uncharacterised protein [Providencia stuartii]|nr:Uncharacterised protein [Providencia stuartii]